MLNEIKNKIIEDISNNVNSEDRDTYCFLMEKTLNYCLHEPRVLEDENHKIIFTLRPSVSQFLIENGDMRFADDSQLIADMLILKKDDMTKHIISNLVYNTDADSLTVSDLLNNVAETKDSLGNLLLVSNTIFSDHIRFGESLKVSVNSGSFNLEAAKLELEDPLRKLTISSSGFSFLHKNTLENIGIPESIGKSLSQDWESRLNEFYKCFWQDARDWIAEGLFDKKLNNDFFKGLTDARAKFVLSGKDSVSQKYRLDFFKWCDEILREHSDSRFSFHELPDAIILSKNATRESTIANIDRGAYPFQLVLKDYLPSGVKPKSEYLYRISNLKDLISIYYFNNTEHEYDRLLGSIASSEFLDYEKVVELFTDSERPSNCYGIFNSVSQALEGIYKGEINIKREKQKWNWLLRGKSYKENIDNLNEKYKTETLADLGGILQIYSETVEKRLMLEKAKELDIEDDVFRISDELGVSIDEDFYESELKRKIELDSQQYYLEDEDDFFVDSQSQLESVPSSISDYSLSSSSKSGKSYKELCEINLKIHKAFSSFNSKLGDFHKRDISWSPLCEDFEYDGLTITNITSRRQLLTLGDELQHCAYTYLDRLMTGDSSIFEIRDNASGKILTSFEIQFDDDEDHFVSKQHYGFKNECVSEDRPEYLAHESFIQSINNGSIQYDRDIELENEDILESVGDDMDTLDSARVLSRYDFGTDAAHMSFFILTSIIDRESYLELLLEHDLASDKSQFLSEIDIIDRLADENNTTPLKVIDKKIKSKFEYSDPKLETIMKSLSEASLSI